jgi:uncharacterized protein YmfQ (DUF2313 family)
MPISQDIQTNILASCLPQGKFWAAKNNPAKKLYRLLHAFAGSFVDFDNISEAIIREFRLNNINELIQRYEEDYGIPDGCFSTIGSLADRRRNIILKAATLIGVSTIADFQRIADVFGFNVIIRPGEDQFNIDPTPFVDIEDSRFAIAVTFLDSLNPNTFPLPFPIQFRSSNVNILRCIFDLLRPANCRMVYIYPDNP